MAKADIDYGVRVTREYGVVPRSRYRDNPAAWPAPKPKNWRTYYGYTRNCLNGGSFDGKFSDAVVATAKIAHDELGGTLIPWNETKEGKTAAFMAEAVKSVTHVRKPARIKTPRERGKNGVDYGPLPAADPVKTKADMAMEAVAEYDASHPRPDIRIVSPKPVVAASVFDRMALVAETLRELADAYGPRRAHKLLAMADFVIAHSMRAKAAAD